MEGWDLTKFKLRVHAGTQFLLGLLSWLYVPPLSLLLYNLTFLPDTDS